MKNRNVLRSGASLSVFLIPAVMALALGAAGALRAQEPPGFLGVQLGEVPDDVAAQLDIKGGAIVVDVVPASPAEKAGLKRHDVVAAAAGQNIDGPARLREVVRALKPGEKLQLEVRRGGKTMNLEATLGEPPVQESTVEKPQPPRPGFLGVLCSPVSPALAAHLSLDEGAGAVVEEVREDSPAARSGIEVHDILLQINGAAVRGPNDLPRLLGERREGDKVELELVHKGEHRKVSAVLAAPPNDIPGFDVPYGLQHRFPRLHFETRPRMRGKLFWREPDGSEHSFDMPELLFDPEELGKDFRDLGESLHDQFRNLPENLQERIQDLLHKYDFKKFDLLKPGREPGDVFELNRSERQSVSRLVDGDLDITLRDDNGVRTITVNRGEKNVVKDLPFDQIGTLPADIRERVEKLIESSPGFRVEEGGGAAPKLQEEPKKEPGRIRLPHGAGVKV